MPKRMLRAWSSATSRPRRWWCASDRRFTHPIYKKTIRRSKNYHAHDENNQFKPGDTVWIEESKPISKLKRWTVVRGEQQKNGLRSARFRRVKTSGNFRRNFAYQKEDEVHQ